MRFHGVIHERVSMIPSSWVYLFNLGEPNMVVLGRNSIKGHLIVARRTPVYQQNYASSLLDFASSLLDHASSLLDYASSLLDYASSLLYYASSLLDYASSLLDYVLSLLDYT
jgi:hypothetical protein